MRFSTFRNVVCSLIALTGLTMKADGETKKPPPPPPPPRAAPAPPPRPAPNLFGGGAAPSSSHGVRPISSAPPAANGARRETGNLSGETHGVRPITSYAAPGARHVTGSVNLENHGVHPGATSPAAKTTYREPPGRTNTLPGGHNELVQPGVTRPGNFSYPSGARPAPRLGPAPKLHGVAEGQTLRGAVTPDALARHRVEYARNYGPGHDALRDRATVAAHERDFHTRDVRAFDDAERRAWAAGRWHRDWHYGRWGWWYDVGDVWYPYPMPVYPYPLTVTEIVVPDGTVVETPDGTEVDSPDAASQAAPTSVWVTDPATGEQERVMPLPAPPQVNYQCPTPDGTYPVVLLCPNPWVVQGP